MPEVERIEQTVTERRPTETSNFGAGRRESHDASKFYARFPAPVVSDDDTVTYAAGFDTPQMILGDARSMDAIPDNSVALVVTSPPYFAGKQYEEDLSREEVPTSYIEYLTLLREVFAECLRVLEPGGRIAVNVANLGRKPYRSLSADVIRILQDDLRLLLRGEVIWQKAEGAGGSVAWGSYRSAANPVLRDLTERVIIASKGRFDRAKPRKSREAEGLPFETHTAADEFMEATLDVWNIRAESARRVNHPAPFPVELPQRLIMLYTFENDLVLDPFAGSGSSLVAAVRRKRRAVGYDLEPEYVEAARERIASEVARLAQPAPPRPQGKGPVSFQPELPDPDESFQARATREGKAAQGIARQALEEAGFKVIKKDYRLPGGGVQFNFLVADATDKQWLVDVSGAFSATRGGLRRTDTVWKALGRALVLRETDDPPNLLLLSSHLPKRPSEGDKALRAAGPDNVFDVIQLLSKSDQSRLALYATGGTERAVAGFWSEQELDRQS
ncbi:MAG: site-specific DNA-methyltransferase [Acidimicrobiia bacterium]|nr:site-specific DNA-methyltransferase [Acidimicrobiia bacterium]NNF63425.1 site-specific DNA-methyltransferase [Acidimicrobiia bacterium]